MSFITKRERVFNDYDLFDLPARNEGKLKAYASCTDARAWSHFCSDKSEHLVEIIKRNNETVRPKYFPTSVIVDTLMVAKNAEIARLKRKIEEFEQLLIAYDQLELSCDQKCEIANAHAAIKAANKELDEMCLDLDLSGFTEGIDSEGFETGKSRGDEATPKTSEETSPKKDTKAVQNDSTHTSDVATICRDPRIDDMRDTIIAKDAKLSAMQNTIAVMENDVCEPYCIYAHIYAALEKIFGVLCQNDKYRNYLRQLTAGKDTRCIDIKGKILFKLKVLEKFCDALIAPCTQDFVSPPPQNKEKCECYRVDVMTRVEPTYALTSSESKHPTLDNKRAQLVADIIQNEEMKEILSKESSAAKPDEEVPEDNFVLEHYNIDSENIIRLKCLQENYDDLMTCYESLKHEKDSLELRCAKYETIEQEFENLKGQMREYNSLWNEKEHYRKRSADLDSLKEKYLVLTDETSNLETQLKAESEINNIKCKAIEGLRGENILLEKKLNEASIAYEKEKNALLCKLNEADCRVMCQGQQIKSLSQQIDKLLEQDQERVHSREVASHSIALIDEIESSKEQIKNLRDILFCNEEEKQELQKQYQDNLALINDLKLNIEEWKSSYAKSLQQNEHLEKYTENLIEETRLLSQDVKEKSTAIENLINVIKNKSHEINTLMHELEEKKTENKDLIQQFNELRNKFDSNLVSLENEKIQAIKSLQIARQDSQELLDKVKDYDQLVHKKADVTKSLELQLEDNKGLQNLLMNAMEENKSLKLEIKRLHDHNEYALHSINRIQDENNLYKTSLELTQKESGELRDRIMHFENLTLQFRNLQQSHDKLIEEKRKLENELFEKSNVLHSIELTKRESDEFINKLQQSENSKDYELSNIKEELIQKRRDIDNLTLQNKELLQRCGQFDALEQEIKMLQNDFDNKTKEINNLYNTLENKIEENRELTRQLKSLEENHAVATDSIRALQDENSSTQTKLSLINKESAELVDRIKHYETLEQEFHQLKRAHDQMIVEKDKLQNELSRQLSDLKKMEQENYELQNHSQNLLTHSEDLETALLGARTELIKKSSFSTDPYKEIVLEIEEMRKEKLLNQNKIRELLDKLDESENIIGNLGEDVLARDDRIATLQNHINELEEEVRRLHSGLAEVIDTGEQMKNFSFQKLDSLKNMEAHHSRATHNMKMELAKLHQENSLLSEQLSVTKIRSEESSRDKRKYESEFINLKNELEIIVTDIKQLELKSVGESALSPNNCDVEAILLSLDRIRKCFDARTSKSSLLEQTLSKVQTSSQLLLRKADEAKILVEKEKQKIINEKEDAIIDRQKMEKQLVDLKERLEKQIADDDKVIQDLEATILNQKLLIDRINQSTQNYISKLKTELQTLNNLYQNSVEKINELQEQVQNMNQDNSNYLDMMDKIKANLEEKSKEVTELQRELDCLKNKPVHDMGIQVHITVTRQSIGTQTEEELLYNETEKMYSMEKNVATKEAKDKNIEHKDSFDTMKKNKPPLDRKRMELESKQNQHILNEVQILTANIEPAFEKVKSSYVDYKMKQLGPRKVEQYSIACLTDNENSEQLATASTQVVDRHRKKHKKSGDKKYVNTKIQSNNLIDIYNRQSILTISSKGNDGSEIIDTKIESRIQGKSHDSNETVSISKDKDTRAYGGSTSDKSADKDLFVVYNDSEGSYNNKGPNNKQGTWPGKGQSELVVEAVTVHPTKKGKSDEISHRKTHIEKDTFIYHEDGENGEDDSVKHKLKINLPRVGTETNSLETTSDGDKKSLDSYTLAIYSSTKRLSDSDTKINDRIKNRKHASPSLPTMSNDDNQYLGSYNSLGVGSDENVVQPKILKSKAIETDSGTSKQKDSVSKQTGKTQSPFNSESHHKLSRVGADVLLIKRQQNHKAPEITRRNFGLEYILDTVQGEVDPNVEQYYETVARKTRSDERFNLVKKREKTDSSPSRLTESPFKFSSPEYKTISSYSKSTSEKSQCKCYAERSVMTQLDGGNDYENKINSLTRALENIERDYKKKIEAIKIQYDSNIKSIINEHNQGVKSIQSLHEETLQDIIKLHENEVENLRSMSIEAMRKAEKLQKENRALKVKVQDCSTTCLDEEPVKITSPEPKKRRKCRGDSKILTKTTVEAFNVKPKTSSNGPCTCSLDVNISDTIRKLFEQVDVEQRKMAENTYMKYIASKILNVSNEGSLKVDGLHALDAQELSFLHLKVCRMWKHKLSKEESLQKRIDSLENELINKQRNAQQHIVELDRKVAEERRRLQEVREAVCRTAPVAARRCNPDTELHYSPPPEPRAPPATVVKDSCGCNADGGSLEVGSRRSAGDLVPDLSPPTLRSRRPRIENTRAVLARLDFEERRERRLYHGEPPTRLRQSIRPTKK